MLVETNIWRFFMSLYLFKKNQKCIIEKVPDNSLLLSMGIRKGTLVEVLTKQPFGGPIVLKSGNNKIAVDKVLALDILASAVDVVSA